MAKLNPQILSIADCVKPNGPEDTWKYVLVELAVEIRNNPRRKAECHFYLDWWDSLSDGPVEWKD